MSGKTILGVVVTGFVAKSETGVPTTLKRSGSDYSATIFAKLTNANRVTMWKNTDGVYTHGSVTLTQNMGPGRTRMNPVNTGSPV